MKEQLKELLWEAFCAGFNANYKNGDSEIAPEDMMEDWYPIFEKWYDPVPEKTPQQKLSELVDEKKKINLSEFSEWIKSNNNVLPSGGSEVQWIHPWDMTPDELREWRRKMNERNAPSL